MALGIVQLLEQLHREGGTIVMVTHDLQLAARAERRVSILDGQITALMEQPLRGAGTAQLATAAQG